MISDALLEAINDRHDSSWEVVASLEGGYQEGAHELRDPNGNSLILKVVRFGSEDRLNSTARLIQRAREAGWPTPAWKVWGYFPDGTSYYVTDFVDGAKLKGVDSSVVDSILEVIDEQANLHPETNQDWSSYAWRVVFEGESGFVDEVRGHSAQGRDFVAIAERVAAPHRVAALPTSDLVHGDFSPENLLLVDATPWVIDVNAAGKGTRIYDVASLVMRATDETARARLMDYALDVSDKGIFAICVMAKILGIASFGVSHWPHDVDRYLRASLERLEAIQMID